MLSNVRASIPLLRLVAHIVVQQGHVLRKLLLVINISVRSAQLIVGEGQVCLIGRTLIEEATTTCMFHMILGTQLTIHISKLIR